MNIRKFIRLFAIFTFVYFCFELKVSAANIDFCDFSSISELDNKYSYGTIFCTETTSIVPLCEVEIEGNDYIANTNEDLIVKITDCAIDEDHDLCDVIVTIDNAIHFYGEDYRNKFRLSYSANIANNTFSTSHVGEIMYIVVPSIHSEKDVTLDYYKAGSNERANINGVCGMVLNLNVPAATGARWIKKNKPTSGFCLGNEAVASQYDAKVYWDTSSNYISINNTYNALECPSRYREGTFKDNVCLIVQDEKASFKIKYGGIDCSLGLVFTSPYKFVNPAPEIIATKSEVLENEEFSIELYQYVPNNYFASILSFINNNNLYTGFELQAIIYNSSIKNIGLPMVENESDQDVSQLFELQIQDGIISASLKPEYLNSRDFYNHLYVLKFPVSYKENNNSLNSQDFGVQGITNISADMQDAGVVITRVKTILSIYETWNDNNNIDNTRGQNSVIDIYNGETQIQIINLNEENSWHEDVEALKYDENGNLLEYRIAKENPQDCYDMWIENLIIYNNLNCLIRVNYIDKYSNIRILDQEILYGIAGGSTTVSIKDFEGYEIEAIPETNVIFDRKEKEVNIYYKRKLPELPAAGSSGMILNYILGEVFLSFGILIYKNGG